MNNDPLQDERLSAYLDGELSDEERALVERELESSDDQRQLVEEFRALSALLKSVPQEPLGDDFSQQVLRKAERAMLATPRRDGEEGEGNSASVPLGRADAGSNTVWRRVVWSSLAVAAALLIMVFNGQWPANDREIVKTSESADMSSAKVAAAGEPVESDRLDGADEAIESEAMKSAVASKAEGRSDSNHDSDRPEMFFGKGGAGGLDDRVSKSGGEIAKAEAMPAPSKPGDQFVGKGGHVVRDGLVGGRDEGLSVGGDKNGAVMGANFIVVNVKMSAEAYENGAFNSLLVKNDIRCNDPTNYGVDLESSGGRLAGEPSPSRGAGTMSRSVGRSAQSGKPVTQDYVYVEAPEKQIVAAIAQLNTAIKEFSSVEVEPSIHMPDQQSLTRFNRIGDQPLAAYLDPLAPRYAKQRTAKQSKDHWESESLPPTPTEEEPLREKAVDKLGMKTDSKPNDKKLSEGPTEGKDSPEPNGAPQVSQQTRQTVQAQQSAPKAAPLEPGEAGVAQLEDLNRSKFGTPKSSDENNQAQTQQKSPQTYSFELGQRKQQADADLPPGYRASKQAAPSQRLLNRAIETNASTLSSNLFGREVSKKNLAQAKRVPLDQQLLAEQTLEMHRQANKNPSANATQSFPTPSSGLGSNSALFDSAPVQQPRRLSNQDPFEESDSDGASGEGQTVFQRQAGPIKSLRDNAQPRNSAEQSPAKETGEGQSQSKRHRDIAKAGPTEKGAQQMAGQAQRGSARATDNVRVLFLLEVEEKLKQAKAGKSKKAKKKKRQTETSSETKPPPAKEVEKTKQPAKAP